MSVSTETRKEIYKKYGGSETNSGSTEAQIALLTHRITHITGHLRGNKKDFSTLRSLGIMVSKRKKLLKYLGKKDIVKYRKLISDLDLRR
ncbi:MAG: 30S ribosomal protein S15 [Bacteroidetes bacterium]|nr:30S ribosomal protein S15 [Bacteroidota bacterium]